MPLEHHLLKPQKNISCLQHVPFEGPALIAAWAIHRGYGFSTVPLYLGGRLPDPGESDLLVVMGGPMGVHDADRLPWMRPEKKAIEAALRAKRKVLGVCLGAQMIADVLGARVYKGPAREIGWHAIERTDEASRSVVGEAFPDRLDVFHWHGDTFDLPGGAVLLARSQAYDHQAFIYKELALGLQFHLEMGRPQLEAIIDNCRGELEKGPYIQTEDEILGQAGKVEATAPVLYRLLDLLLG